jgi:hypothetical protein
VEPEPQRDAAPAALAQAPNLMFNIGGLLKMSQTITTFFTFPFTFSTISIKQKSKEKSLG